MNKQQLIFISTISFISLMLLGWYFGYYSSLNKDLNQMNKSYNDIKNEKTKFQDIKRRIPLIEKEWTQTKNELNIILDRIPSDRDYDNISKMLRGLINQNRLAIDNYNESTIAIDTKEIFLPETNETLIIEKFPIDIELRGSFLDFGNFLDQLSYTNYHITISNMYISQNKYSEDQNISFISYVYTKSSDNEVSYNQNYNINAAQKQETTISNQNLSLREVVKTIISDEKQASLTDLGKLSSMINTKTNNKYDLAQIVKVIKEIKSSQNIN